MHGDAKTTTQAYNNNIRQEGNATRPQECNNTRTQ